MRSLPAGRSGKPEANPAEAHLLQLFWEVELYLRKRLAASQAGSLPPQVSFLMRSPCAQIPPAGGDPVDFENKDMRDKSLKSSGFRSIPRDSAGTRDAPCGFPQNPLYLFANLYTMTDREKTDLLISCKKRKAAGELSDNLAKPVPSSIKNECLKVYREGKRPEGAMILQQFIKKGQFSDFAAAVEAIDIDRFRPTVRLLKEGDFKPEEKHYELLAWLLGPELVIGTDGDGKKRPALAANPKKKWIGLAALSVLGGVIWMISGLFHPQCMYWTGSEYKAVSCTIHAPGMPVYAIDTRRLDHFKRIMKPDTVTAVSVGRVWYFKAGHSLELYTDSGRHPVLTNRRLRPLTLYMQEKYLSKKTNNKKSPDLVVSENKY